MTFLSVIIPAYNEEDRLPVTIKRVSEFLHEKEYKSEIIIVENGSTDATTEVAEMWLTIFTAFQKNVRGRVIHSEKGKGAAVRKGMLMGQGTWLYMADADLSSPVETIDMMTPPEFVGDVAIGSRSLPGASHVVKGTPMLRKISGGIFNMLTRLLLPGVSDTQCGFKMFRREVAKQVFSASVVDGWAFDVEILYLARLFGYEIEEKLVYWKYDADSRVNLWGDSVEMAADLFRIWVRGRSGEYETQSNPARI